MDLNLKVTENLNNLKEEIKNIADLNSLNDLKIKYLGKKGFMQEMPLLMRNATPEEKPLIGKIFNTYKEEATNLINEALELLEEKKLQEQMEKEKIDVTLPATEIKTGNIHPLNLIINDIEEFFIGMGYEIKEGPEVETDVNNFERLNIPKDHPARDMQDTLYIDVNNLLRTHTSPVQARTMLEMDGKPIRIICPGKVYRKDDDDATHSHQFMQIEGLVLGSNITFADLKGTLLALAKHVFGENREIRLRPSYFPFTEPSVEVDVSCMKCNKKGCNICKNTGYIEVLGAGMVNDNVLRMCGYDPKKIRGFAFGVGVERLAMLKYNIDDIRHFYTNDLRFLRQFKGGK